MNINTRLQKLEQQIPPAPEPQPDLSGLSTDELRFMVRHIGVQGNETVLSVQECYQPYDDLTPEEREIRLEAIYEKIIWR